jgi:hypothetical protein
MKQKQKFVEVPCVECKKDFVTEKYWWGTAEICGKCIILRDERDKCERHGGKEGKNCTVCHIEDKFNSLF